jgi:hypothetical protein
MAQGKRNRLSMEQRIDMWRRWKAGESLHEIGRAFDKAHNSIRFLLKQRAGSFLLLVGAHRGRSRWPSGKTSHEESLPVCRSVR